MAHGKWLTGASKKAKEYPNDERNIEAFGLLNELSLGLYKLEDEHPELCAVLRAHFRNRQRSFATGGLQLVS